MQRYFGVTSAWLRLVLQQATIDRRISVSEITGIVSTPTMPLGLSKPLKETPTWEQSISAQGWQLPNPTPWTLRCSPGTQCHSPSRSARPRRRADISQSFLQPLLPDNNKFLETRWALMGHAQARFWMTPLEMLTGNATQSFCNALKSIIDVSITGHVFTAIRLNQALVLGPKRLASSHQPRQGSINSFESQCAALVLPNLYA